MQGTEFFPTKESSMSNITIPTTGCRRCHGEGSVPDNRHWRRDPQFEIDVQCPVCHGTGERPLKDYEVSMGLDMGAFPGQFVIYGDIDGEIRVEQIDFITDHDGYMAPSFVFDCDIDYMRGCQPEDVLAVVLAYKDPESALAEYQAVTA
jgi:hypothetical protein